MSKWEKPLLVVSKCLDNEKCRYNGEACSCKTLEGLKEFADFIDICPEEAIGLGTPRNAIRIVENEGRKFVLDSKTYKDYTKNFTEFAEEVCIDLEHLKPQGFVLKTKSPSCGISDVKIYKNLEKGAAGGKGKGMFGETVCNNFNYLPIEDDGRLKNYSIRENFYTKIFTLAKYRVIEESLDFGKLVEFHGSNKLLFMTFSQKITKKMGQVVSDGKSVNKKEIFQQYGMFLNLLFKGNSKFKGYINVFYKILGYFSENLTKDEKQFFLNEIDEFRKGKIPQKVILTLIESYAVRFQNQYLLKQSILEPYPKELMDLDDSGKGIVR
ncbi:MAG: YbgA family protein [Sarcina sp.]